MQIVDLKLIKHRLNLAWSSHGLRLPHVHLNCSVYVGVLGSPYQYNATEGCPEDGENRTEEIPDITSGQDYEVCLLASSLRITFLRNCTTFNATALATESEGTTSPSPLSETTTTIEADATTVRATTVLPPSEKMTTTSAATQTTMPSLETEEETSATLPAPPHETTTTVKTGSTAARTTTVSPSSLAKMTATPVTMQTTPPSFETENETTTARRATAALPPRETPTVITAFQVHGQPVFVLILLRQDHLQVTWTRRNVTSPCRFNITVMKNGAILAHSEVPCGPKGHIGFNLSDLCSDYDVCFASEHLQLVDECHSVTAAKFDLRCAKEVGNIAPVSSTGGEGVGLPISLVIVLAALVLTALVVVIIVVCRRRRARVVKRKKNDESALQLQMNRRSGSYAVSVIEQQRGVYQPSNCQTFGKVSQRTSSIDEL